MRLLLESESVSKALGLAAAAHKGQVDKAGEDYIKHRSQSGWTPRTSKRRRCCMI